MPSEPRLHPADDVLIGYAGGEARESGDVDLTAAHLAECPECRARVSEIQATFGNYSAYVADLKRELPLPPQPWFELRLRMRDLDSERRPRLIRFPSPRVWWAAAAAAIAAAVVIPWLTGPRAVSASELLQKAVAQERTVSPRRELQVKIRNLVYKRPARANRETRLKVAESRTDAELSRRFAAAGYNWDDPLSAASFSTWRSRLEDKRDVVDVLKQAYRIETSSASNELAAVALTLRASDFHPVAETFRFRDNSTVEISDAGVAPPAVAPAAPAKVAVEPEPETPSLTPGDELRVIAALNSAGADLGEPVDVTRDEAGRKVQVTATGLDPARQEELRAALSGMPNVDLRFQSPPSVTRSATDPGAEAVQAPGPMHKRLADYFGRRTLVDGYVNDVLAGSERILSRAHALRALSERFPEHHERGLEPAEREVLNGLVRQHASALREAAEQLPSTLEPLIGSPPEVPAASCAAWQECALETVQATQQLDAALSRALASAQPSQSPERAAAEIREALASWLARVRAWN